MQVEAFSTNLITISGQNFTPSTTMSIPNFDGTINNLNVISPTTMELNITTGDMGLFDFIASNSSALNTQWSGNGVDLLEVLAPNNWVDLRLGGDSFSAGNAAGNDIRYKSGMTLSRDADGMYFTGIDIWYSWVKFESLGWTRGENKTLEWIFTNTDNKMMIGIGSTETDENAIQYTQMEIVAYFNNPTNFYGFYGSDGTVGTRVTQADSASTGSCTSNVFKIKFLDDGSTGKQFTLYCLPSSAEVDWDDETTPIKDMIIQSTIKPSQINIMPFIIPTDGGTQRFIAIRIR